MEITMTDESVLRWLHEVLGVGTLNKKPRKGLRKDGTKYLMQYKWRCTFRDAYYVCKLLWPYAHTKLPKIQQVIEHYAKEKLEKGANIIDLEGHRFWTKHSEKYSSRLSVWCWQKRYGNRKKIAYRKQELDS